MSFSNSGGRLRMKVVHKPQNQALREQILGEALTFHVELKFKPEDLERAQEWAERNRLAGFDGMHHLLYEALMNGVIKTHFKEAM